MERPPQMLQIVRESLNEGSEAAYRTIEEDAARICADLNCPNAHLAMESLTGPKEIWWLTPYESESDRQRVTDGYASNRALMAVLEDILRPIEYAPNDSPVSELMSIRISKRPHGFIPAVQLRTTVNGGEWLGPTGVARRNRLPSALTSPRIAPDGGWKSDVGVPARNSGPAVTPTAIIFPSGAR